MSKADILAIDPSDEMSAVLDSCVGSIPFL
jgi:hypothetical protein